MDKPKRQFLPQGIPLRTLHAEYCFMWNMKTWQLGLGIFYLSLSIIFVFGSLKIFLISPFFATIWETPEVWE